MTESRNERLAELRHRMVETQIRARGVRDARVLAAMTHVPREEFVPAELRDQAFVDHPLPIGGGQTISQPFTVAFMAEALLLNGTEKVLEIGTGSGYAAAVLSRLAAEVHTIERIPELARTAQATLKRLGYRNVHVHTGDGTLGLPQEAPFDAIVVTASGDHLPAPFKSQLAAGGRIVMPVGDEGSQTMFRWTSTPDGLATEDLGGFLFVPLIGVHGRRRFDDLTDG